MITVYYKAEKDGIRSTGYKRIKEVKTKETAKKLADDYLSKKYDSHEIIYLENGK